jgi:hypothetical protein
MSFSANEFIKPVATGVDVTDDTISVELSDGRTITVPVSWYPRLDHATPAERKNWQFIGSGHGIHWADVDEDISVEALIAGKPSNETQASLRQWLKSRSA